MNKAAWLDTSLHAPRPTAEIEVDGLASRPGVQMMPVKGGRLRVRTQIEPGAPALLVIPDGPNTLEQYDPVFDRFRGRLSVVAIDPPGYGFSYADHPGALNYAETVAAMASAIEALSLPAWVFTGSCVNAYIAIGLAERLRELALGVVAAQATDYAGERRWVHAAVDPQGFLAEPVVGQLLWANPDVRSRMGVDGWYRAAAGPDHDVTAWKDIAKWTIRCGCSNALPSIIQLWFGDEALPVPQVNLPSVVLWGESDRTHARCKSDPRGLLEYLPDAEVWLSPRAGHFPDLEDLDAFERAVMRLARPTA